MIDIVIPYYTGAAIACLGMITSILLIVIGAICGKGECVVAGVALLFAFDTISALMSSSYLTTPTNGWSITPVNGKPRCLLNDGGVGDCVYPTVNPYEVQPIHPILWTVGFFHGALQLGNGAIKISGGVAP